MKNFFLGLMLLNITSVLHSQVNSLEYFISAAKQNSPLLNDYYNQISINQLDSMLVRKTLGLQVNANSNDYYAPVIHTWGYDEIATNIDVFTALISVSQQITGKKIKDNYYQSFVLQNSAITNASKITEYDLARTITDAYINAYADLKQLQFNTSLLQLLSEEESVLRKLAEANVYKQTDYLVFSLTVKQQAFTVSENEMTYRNSILSLNYLCGISDTNYYEVVDPQLKSTDNSFYTNSLFQKQFQIDSLVLENVARQIDLAYKPKLDVYADAGYVSTFQLDAYKNFGASVGLNLSIPIYDGGQKKLEHQKIELQQQTISGYNTFAEKQYTLQSRQIRNQIAMNEKLRAQIDTQITYAEALLEANKKLLAIGDVTMADYLLMLNDYKDIQSQFIQLEVTKYQLLNQLNYLSTAN